MMKIVDGCVPPALVIAAVLGLAGCDRGDRIPLPPSDTAPGIPSSDSGQGSGAADGSTAPTVTASADSTMSSSGTAPGEPGAPGSVLGSGTAAAPLTPADSQFVSRAAEEGQFELEAAKLAAEKASDPAVKSFAQMLVADHGSSNEQLRRIAASHQVSISTSLPEDKRRELEQLGKLTGAQFDRQFVQMAGIDDHRHDIEEFERAAASATGDDVKRFAQSTLASLKRHLAAAERLPAAVKG